MGQCLGSGNQSLYVLPIQTQPIYYPIYLSPLRVIEYAIFCHWGDIYNCDSPAL
jgi:hypothetical protein